MSFLRRANTAEVRRIETPDGDGWIELYGEFSKKQINQVVLAAPKAGDDVSSSLAFVERFFQIAVKGWSMVDDEGNPVPATIEEYRALAAEPSAWVDRVLVEHLQATIGKNVEDAEGKRSS